MSGSLPPGSTVFVRKLARKRHWGSPDQSVQERTSEILANVFLNDKCPYSLYRVSSEADLDRVALALNAGRGSLSEECYFVFFTSAEFQDANITLEQTEGRTPCHYANFLHFDADAAELQLQSLVNQALTDGRDLVRRSRPQMKQVAEQATETRCLAAVPASTACETEGCPQAGSQSQPLPSPAP